MKTGFMTAPVTNHNPTIDDYKNNKRQHQKDVGPGQKEKHTQVLKRHGIHQKKLKNSSELRKRSFNGGKPLFLLLVQLSFPGLTEFLCHDVSRTEGSPDDVGLTKHEATKPKQG